jgi:tetratricopeptide (TPR) repeat protein
MTRNIKRLVALLLPVLASWNWIAALPAAEHLTIGAPAHQSGFVSSCKRDSDAQSTTRLNNDNSETAATLHNLGVLLVQQGDYKTARICYELSLAIRRKLRGNFHIETAETLNNLGVLTNDTGDYCKAHKFLEEALSIKRKVLGDKHPSTMTTREHLIVLSFVEGICTCPSNCGQHDGGPRRPRGTPQIDLATFLRK